MKVLQYLLAIVALGVGFSGQAGAVSILNGSFDASGTTVGAFYNLNATTTGLGGWTLAGLAGAAQIACVVPGAANGQICNGNAPSTYDSSGTHAGTYYFSLYAYPGASTDGGNYFVEDGDSNFNAALYQNVSGLSLNHYYTITFYQAAGEENCVVDDGSNCDPPGGKLTAQWQVKLGSSTQTSSLMTTTVNPLNRAATLTGWQAQSLTFQATAAVIANPVLSFLALGTPNGAPPLVFLDGVQIAEAVPEVDSRWMLGSGLLFLAAGHCWRRK